MIWGIVAFGILCNWIFLGYASKDEPEGAMGMLIAVPFSFIPFLFPIMWLVGKLVG